MSTVKAVVVISIVAIVLVAAFLTSRFSRVPALVQDDTESSH